MVIDSHQHVFWHGRDDAGLIADMVEQGIDVAWLLSWEIVPEEDNPAYHGVLNPEHRRADGTHAGIVLSDLIKARDRYPNRFVLGYCPHPCLGDAPALLEAAWRMHGARICGDYPSPPDHPRTSSRNQISYQLKLLRRKLSRGRTVLRDHDFEQRVYARCEDHSTLPGTAT